MAIKKSELYSSLWQSCDQLRGGMDASQYKDYVLVLLFVKYVSDKYGGKHDALLDVPPGGGFADMVAVKNDKDIGDKLNQIISKLAEANALTGVIDVADFNDPDKLGKGKEMVDRLTNLVSIFETSGLDFKGNQAEGDDILGDAYEYLMRHFATESGKSKGQFYTPAEVSRIMARVIGLGGAKSSDQTIHDPACGSGSLLIKAHDEAKSRTGLDLALYGQEMDNATAALAKMNMILHDSPTAEIWQDNSLSSPYFKQPSGALKTFDFVVANPPFSTKAWSNGFSPAKDEYGRFGYGIPPAKNGDYAFLLHILACLKSTGKGAVILPHGVLFRGNAEGDIRREIVKKGFLKGIIGLPANLFYGTGIPACILVLDKENAAGRAGLFLIDASKGFLKDGNKNRLRAQDIHRIVDTFTNAVEIPGYSRWVPLNEIAANGYNLNLPRYIDGSEPEDVQDRASGHAVLDTLPSGTTAAQAIPLVSAALSQNPAVQGVVVLGGYDLILPLRLDVLDPVLRQEVQQQGPSQDLDDFIVWSDYIYGDTNGDGLAELPVSRIPDGKSAQLVLTALQAGKASTRTPTYGLRNLQRPFADAVYGAFSSGQGMDTSHAVVHDQAPPLNLVADSLYLMLHGSNADGTRFWGEPTLKEAMNLSNVPSQSGAVVFTGCCWGALCADTTALAARPGQPVGARTADNSLALSFLKAGATAFIGCTGSHYSPLAPPFNFFGQPLHEAFWRHLRSGVPPSRALLNAKNDYVAGMPHGRTSPQGRAIEMKILREYACLGLGW